MANDGGFSRRNVLKGMAALGALASGGTALAQAPPQAPAAAAGRGAGAAPGRHNLPEDFADPWPGKLKLLAIGDITTGYQHDSVPIALETVSRLGQDSGSYITFVRSDTQLITKAPGIHGQGPRYGNWPNVNGRTLSFFHGLFMLPSGTGQTLMAQQKADLLSFIRDDGHGLVVGHAAGTGYYEWPEWFELIGGRMGGEFNSTATYIVEDPQFPGAQAFGTNPFTMYEQHPILTAPYSRKSVRVIMRLDPNKLGAKPRNPRPDGDYPMVWAHQYGKGRVFSFGDGHFPSTWANPEFQKMVLGGIQWALGMWPADVNPRPLPA